MPKEINITLYKYSELPELIQNVAATKLAEHLYTKDHLAAMDQNSICEVYDHCRECLNDYDYCLNKDGDLFRLTSDLIGKMIIK